VWVCVCVCVCVWVGVGVWVGGWVRACVRACARVRVCTRVRANVLETLTLISLIQMGSLKTTPSTRLSDTLIPLSPGRHRGTVPGAGCVCAGSSEVSGTVPDAGCVCAGSSEV
jgi:hypothetical protein